ncbi:hypothetical protein GCM10023083_62900 [Streptomyces phyllanthi]
MLGAFVVATSYAVPLSQTAAANSLNPLARTIGSSLSSALAGVVFSQMTTPLGPVEGDG